MPNIFVLGLNESQRSELRSLPDSSDLSFHQLLTLEELRHGDPIPIKDLLAKATAHLEEFTQPIDAIIGFWDFPVTSMVPILSHRFGLRSSSLEAVLKCEHKYWSRLEQSAAIDEYPRFGIVDPETQMLDLPEGISYPVWVKPVKSASSVAAHRLENHDDLVRALDMEKDHLRRVGKPFDYLLSLVDLPREIAEVGGQAFLVEEEASGLQVTVEGYSTYEEIEIYGVIDSVTYPASSSFLRYQYPSSLPEHVVHRLTDVSRRIISHVGLKNSMFNIEYFYDPSTDSFTVLEVNPRHSQSHARLFKLVDGISNHKIVVDLALGKRPTHTFRRGLYNVAAKWFPRKFDDRKVKKVPTRKEILRIQHEIPGTFIDIVAQQGNRLSELPDQDSYSFGLANVFVGAADEDELWRKYRRCMAALDFDLEVDD